MPRAFAGGALPRDRASLEAELRRQFGVAQLELELASQQHADARAPSGVAVVSAPPCQGCGRWNYHLVGCTEVR